MNNKQFWDDIVKTWILIETVEERESVTNFIDNLFQNPNHGKIKKIKSLEDELFGGND